MDNSSGASKPVPSITNLAALSPKEYIELSQSYGTRYVIGNSPRKAYIFNNQSFDECLNCHPPNSNSNDPVEMKAVLSSLNFNVKVFEDLSMGDLRKTLKGISLDDHQDTVCIVIVIITSGRLGVLYAKDDQYLPATLWDGFVGDRCPGLVGKPKLFFIQSHMPTVTLQSSRRDAQGEIANYVIPSMADVMVMYSCSFENGGINSEFIQLLCDELRENGRKKELLEMLRALLRRIQSKQSVKQEQSVPIIVSTLTKELYFP